MLMPLALLQDVAALLDRGVYDNEVLLREGWVSALKYEDEITDDLKKRTGGKVSIDARVDTTVVALHCTCTKMQGACEQLLDTHVQLGEQC